MINGNHDPLAAALAGLASDTTGVVLGAPS